MTALCVVRNKKIHKFSDVFDHADQQVRVPQGRNAGLFGLIKVRCPSRWYPCLISVATDAIRAWRGPRHTQAAVSPSFTEPATSRTIHQRVAQGEIVPDAQARKRQVAGGRAQRTHQRVGGLHAWLGSLLRHDGARMRLFMFQAVAHIGASGGTR